MITQEIGIINGQKLLYHQIENMDEAKKEKMPEGIWNFWTIGSRRIFSPGEIVGRVIDGNFKSTKTVKDYKEHYKQLVANQKKQVVDYLKEAKEKQKSLGAHPEILKHIDEAIKQYDAMPSPDSDGIFRPTKKQAEKLAGESLDNIYTPEQIEAEFGR